MVFGSPCIALEAGFVLIEDVVVMGVAGAVGWLEGSVEVLVKLDGTYQCLLKVFCWLMLKFGYAWMDYDGIHDV